MSASEEGRAAQARVITYTATPTNAWGVAGFVTSLVGILTCGILSPVGLMFSFFGLFRRPRGFATAGLVLGLLGSLWILAVVAVAIAGATAAASGVSQAAGPMMTQVRLERVEAALEAYHARAGFVPAYLDQLSGFTGDELEDAWGKALRYSPDLDGHGFTVASSGPDRIAANEDDIVLRRTLTPVPPQLPGIPGLYEPGSPGEPETGRAPREAPPAAPRREGGGPV